jgi:hypothetical protein
VPTPNITHLVDFCVTREGGLYLFSPQSPDAREFAVEAFADAQQWAGSYVCEHRFAADVVGDLLERGYAISIDGQTIRPRAA